MGANYGESWMSWSKRMQEDPLHQRYLKLRGSNFFLSYADHATDYNRWINSPEGLFEKERILFDTSMGTQGETKA